MILVDFSSVMISKLLYEHSKGEVLDENFIRHSCLERLRNISLEFKTSDYGKLVLCCDSSEGYWRKEFFPYYKIQRRKAQLKSKLDWKFLGDTLSKIIEEWKEWLPYRIVKVKGAEADDVIATIVKAMGDWPDKRNLIVSSDMDFLQLQKYPNVEQFSLNTQTFMKSEDPEGYLLEKIIRGESSDSIPNILSDDDFIANGVRQKPITKKRMSEILNNGVEEQYQNNFNRNKTLIDFDMIPKKISTTVLMEYSNLNLNPKDKMLNYLIEKKMTGFLNCLQDF